MRSTRLPFGRSCHVGGKSETRLNQNVPALAVEMTKRLEADGGTSFGVGQPEVVGHGEAEQIGEPVDGALDERLRDRVAVSRHCGRQAWPVIENPFRKPYCGEHHVLVYRGRQSDEEPQAGPEPGL